MVLAKVARLSEAVHVMPHGVGSESRSTDPSKGRVMLIVTPF